MYARAIDDAAHRLSELRRDEWQDLALGLLALGGSLVATQLLRAFAVPLFAGGAVVLALGVRALWLRWDLVERLAGERDAHVIPEVLAFASREATPERRSTFAAIIRCGLSEPGHLADARLAAARPELEALAAELEDDELELDPASAVACMRLLSDVLESPLLNGATPAEDLRSRVRQIRGGFRRRGLAA
jgi:hypothetical protein